MYFLTGGSDEVIILSRSVDSQQTMDCYHGDSNSILPGYMFES